MQGLRSALEGAAQDGLLDPHRIGELERYLEDRLSAGAFETDKVDDGSMLPDTEAPRFVRGFHDVLISVGVFILLVGLGGAGSILATGPAILVLSEVLIRRQRLALPAVLLSAATALWAVVTSGVVLHDVFPDQIYAALSLQIVPVLVILGLYSWRYRVPLAVALFLASCLALAFTGLLWSVAVLTGSADVLEAHPAAAVGVLVVAALCLFAVAMRYDLSDRLRQTRRSDIAFWLHLMTAPALLYAMISVLLLVRAKDVARFDISDNTLAPPVIGIVAILMLIGILIDRRAFATSGLIALIVAVVRVLRNAPITGDIAFFLALTAVGLVVVLVGISWRYLRRLIMKLVPPALARRLPPVQ